MKKFLSGILASSLILSMSTVSFASETTETPQNVTTIYSQTLSTLESDFTLNDAGVITAYSGGGGNVVIPSTIGGRTVLGIGASAFQNKTSLESVTMPSTLQRIESSAFSGCTNLRVVELNEGLQSIGASAFAYTTALSAIWFPSTVTELGASSFLRSGLTSVYVPSTVSTVGTSAFQECTRLRSAIFMGNVTTLPVSTFYNCILLEDVYLREGIVTIGENAFRACSSMKQITLPSTTQKLDESVFYACSKLEKLDFTNTQMKEVDFHAFQYCISLTEVTFPYGFQKFAFGYNTFYTDNAQFLGCTSLEKVVLPSTVDSLYFRYYTPNISVQGVPIGAIINYFSDNYELLNHPFIDCNPSMVVYGYSGTKVETLSTHTNVFTFSALSASNEDKNPVITPTTAPTLPTKSDMQVVLPVVGPNENANASAETDFVLGVGGIISSYTGNGGDVVIPSMIDGRVVYGIGADAFKGKTNIDSITMPRTLERIETSAFSGCTSLRSVTLNDGLQYIGVSAFASTTSLASIWFPSSLIEIGEKAFDNSGLTSLYVPETVRMMGEYAFQQCSRLRSVIFMGNMNTLPRATFYNCSVLEDVYLHEGMVNIGRSAFNLCTSLEEIILPSSTKYIGQYAFYGCSKLEKMDMSHTRLSIVDQYAFQNCVSLTEAIFPYGFTAFIHGETSMDTDKGQFNGCTSLVKVVLPSTMNSCYFHYTFINFSFTNHPFIDCNPDLVLYSYTGTLGESLAKTTSDVAFSSLGDLSSENKSLAVVPTTPPALPTKPESTVVVVPQVTPEENVNASPSTDFVIGDGGIITSYTGSGGDVVIPSTIDGRAVYGIGASVFSGKTNLQSITMPNTLERIESSAFSGCSNLHTVNLNEGLHYIGASAFSATTSLTSIWFPSSVEELGANSFEKSGLTSLYVPSTVLILGEYVFQECANLNSVILMANIDTVPRATFYKCTSLKDVYLREGIVSISRSAFNNCTALEQITLPSTTKSIGLYGFYNCTALKTMDMSNTQLSVVEQYAFQNCTSLTEAIFPYGFRTFVYGETSMDTDKGQFNGCTSLVKVVVPSTIDTCYHYYRFINYSHLNHPFVDCHPDLVVYGYPNTSVESLATLTNTVTFSSLGDVSGEIQYPMVPTTPPALPSAPSTSTNTNTPAVTTPSAYPSWATTFIDFVSGKIMPDISTSNYGNASSRGLIAQSLYNMSGDGGTYSSNFTDVGNYGNAIGWCFAQGVMAGSGDNWFDTQGNVTREQFALILRQLASLQKKDVNSDTSSLSAFSDRSAINTWAESGVAWAVQSGLMEGNNGVLNPQGSVTQVQVAVMLYKYSLL